MRHVTFFTTTAFGILGIVLSATADQSAASNLPGSFVPEKQHRGWSGNASMYMLTNSGKSAKANLAHQKNTTISSLEDAPDDYNFTTLFPTFSLHYSSSDNTYYSLGVFDTGLTTNSLLENQSLFAVSAHKTFSNDASIWASFTPNIPGLYEAWQDPYLTQSPLQKTDASLQIISAGANYFFGTPFSISASAGDHHIKNDQAGVSMADQLTMDDQAKLQRDTSFSSIRLSGVLPLSNNLFLESGVKIFRANAKGDAQSFDAEGFDLSLVYTNDTIDIYIVAEIERIHFKSTNPVFDKTREQDDYNIYAGVTYKRPFGWRKLSFDAFLGTTERDSNINFYNDEQSTLAMGVTYNF